MFLSLRAIIGDSLNLLSWQFNKNNVRLFHHVLTSSYFHFSDQFYEQTDGVSMGSPLSLVIAIFFMEDFGKVALRRVAFKPTCWFHYVDDTFIIWPHGPKQLKNFIKHLNNIHCNMQFTMETESNGHFLFLDIDIYRRPDGFLGCRVYRKPININLYYLNAESLHYLTNKQSVLLSLLHRARVICHQESLPGELDFLCIMFKQNGYSDGQIHCALYPPCREDTPRELTLVAFLPFVAPIFKWISRLLTRHNIKSLVSPLGRLPISYSPSRMTLS
jgi:hypothetical protein